MLSRNLLSKTNLTVRKRKGYTQFFQKRKTTDSSLMKKLVKQDWVLLISLFQFLTSGKNWKKHAVKSKLKIGVIPIHIFGEMSYTTDLYPFQIHSLKSYFYQ